MGIGISLLLIAGGAVLAFAVESTMEGLDINTVGVILLLVGALGLIWALLTTAAIGPFGRRQVVDDEVVIDRR